MLFWIVLQATINIYKYEKRTVADNTRKIFLNNWLTASATHIVY